MPNTPKCPSMNTKRLIVASIVVFVFVYLYDWVFHGFILKNAYVQTASLWRPEQEMMNYMGFLVFGEFLRSVVFCVLYAIRPGHRDGVGAGIGYGLLIALLLIGTDFITYAVQPLPLSLITSWAIGGLIQLLVAGALLGAIYRPATPVSPSPVRA